MKTGKTILEPGAYANTCCSITLRFSEDHPFPRCPRCGRNCSWQATHEGAPIGYLPLAQPAAPVVSQL